MKSVANKKGSGINLPLLVQKDEAGFFVIECPILTGCLTQGETYDEAMSNIEEVILMALEEEENRERALAYQQHSMGLYTISVTL